MSASEPYIVFELAGSAYGVRSADVQHVEMLEHVTPVPNTPASVEGVVFSRGQVIPALNLRTRFRLPRAEPTASTRLVFLKVQQRLVGLIVDAAREFRVIPTAAIRPVEDTLHGIPGNYLKGVTTVNDRVVFLVDIGAVLDPAELQAADDVEAPASAASTQTAELASHP